MKKTLLLAALSLSTLTACEGDLTEAGATCEAVRTTVTLEEQTALGFSAQDALTSVGADFAAAELGWSDNSVTDLSMKVGAATAATFVDQSPAASEGGQELAMELDCPDYIEISAPLTFQTGDGRFNEQFTVAFMAEVVDHLLFRVEVDVDALVGSYEWVGIDPAEWDEVSLSINGNLYPAGESDGMISEQGAETNDDDGDGTVSAENFMSGAWNTAE